MASSAACNDKHVEMLTPKGALLNASSEVAYAVHVDVVTTATPPQYPLSGGYVVAAATLPSEWEIGFWECFYTPAHCCMALFLPCVNGAYAAHGIGRSWLVAGIFFLATYYGASLTQYSAHSYEVVENHGSYYTTTYYSTTGGVNKNDAISTVSALIFIMGVVLLRHAFRKFYVLPGSIFQDCCYSFWCSCCALSQMSAHTERAKIKNQANVTTLPAYSAA